MTSVLPASAALNLIEDMEKSGSSAATSALQAKANEIRNARVNWKPYVQSLMISQEEYEVMVRLDSPSTRNETLASMPVQSIATLLNLMTKISKDQTVQYLITLIDQILQENKNSNKYFNEYYLKTKQSPWQPFFQMIHRPDYYIANQASRIISKLCWWSEQKQIKIIMNNNDLIFFLNILIKEQLKYSNPYLQSAVRCLQMVLRIPHIREEFLQLGGIQIITDLLHGKLSYQVQYQLIFCLWLLSFNVPIADQISRTGVLSILSEILSDAAKEKVIRIILATFRNMLEKPSEKELKTDNALALIRSKIMKQLSLLENKKYEDVDIIEDLQYVNDQLQIYVQDLSSFDEYSSELKSGQLLWSPVHKSEKFWRENAQRLNEKNFELLKILAKILESSRDPLVLSVASHDLGEYIRHYPHGKRIIEQLGCKTSVMSLLTHQDPNVRYEALLAIQKMMVHNWEYLGKQLQPPSQKQK